MRFDQRSRAIALLGFMILLGAGCAAYTLPLAAHQGSSVAIPLGNEAWVGPLTGYEIPGTPDEQRGMMVLRLLDETTQLPLVPEETLTLRAITRAYPDPASDIGINNDPVPPGVTFALGIGQILAVADVPETAPTGNFLLEVTRKRPSGSMFPLPDSETPSYRVPFTILPGVEQPNDAFAFFNLTPTVFAPLGAVGFDSIYPHPKLVVTLPDPAPTAAHLVVEYPGTKVSEILTVFEEQHLGRQSVVLFTDDTVQDRVVIDLMDPLQSGVKEISLAFAPVAGSGVIAPTEFTIVEEAYYDENGATMAGAASSFSMIR